jgi:long-chain fatty acid transport protein
MQLSDRPAEKNVGSSIGSIGSMALGGGTVPVSPPLVQFVQATLTQPFWQQQISAGAGYQLTENVRVDFQAGYAFDGDRTIGGTDIEVNEFQVGAGFTWGF